MTFISEKNKRPGAVVTGGSGDIGFAICTLLVQKGYHVYLLDLPTSNGQDKAKYLNELMGSEVACFWGCDLSNLNQLELQATSWVNEYGPFEILVNNAGVDTIGPIDGTSLEEFIYTQKVNADAAFVLCKVLSPGMIALGGGQIVNNMSIILSGGWDNRSAYAMSKGSLLGLTRALARELGPHNIRVNAVSPGAIPTKMEHKFWENDKEELDRFIIDRQSLKFRASVQDVAEAVWFLLSPQSRFVTGHELHVNGGWYMG
jgi:3-oxoacyl-[acyl-carrier protein] reductase